MGSYGGVGLKNTRWGHRAPQRTLTIVAQNPEPVWMSSPAGHIQSWKQGTQGGAWGGSNPTLSASLESHYIVTAGPYTVAVGVHGALHRYGEALHRYPQ